MVIILHGFVVNNAIYFVIGVMRLSGDGRCLAVS